MKILKFNEGKHFNIDDFERKPKLEVTIETTHFIYSHNLGNFVKDVYDLDYDFAESEESDHGRYHITGEISPNNQIKVDAVKNRKFGGKYISAHLLLNLICADGHIEPGIYVIES